MSQDPQLTMPVDGDEDEEPETADLPVGWATAVLPDLIAPDGVLTDGDWVESKDQDPDGDVRLTQLADVGDGVFRDRSARFLTSSKAAELRCTYLKPGDVMVARMPDPLGRSCVFPGSPMPCVTVVDVCVVRPGTEEIQPRWLTSFINSPQFRIDVAALQSGSTRKRISKKNLSTISFPVPPSAEQARIADATDSYLSRLDDVVATLERVQRNLKRYRASVLKAAVEGRLVPTEAELARKEGRDYEPADVLLQRILEERKARSIEEAAEKARARAEKKAKKAGKPWSDADDKAALAKGRKAAAKKYEEPEPPDPSELPPLPEGWCWAALPALGELNRGKSRHRPRNDPRLYDGPYPFIQTGDVRAADGFIGEHSQTYSEAGLAQSRLWPAGTLCITIAANIAETGILKFDSCFPDSVVGLLIPDAAVTQFVELFMRTARGELERFAPATAQKNINLKTLSTVAVPVPPRAELVRIVAEIERLLSVGAACEESARLDARRAERLRQSILKWAFEGRLVDQDPVDEPASVLLERIAAEREKAEANNGKKKRRRRARKK